MTLSRNELEEIHRRLAQRKDEMRNNNGGEDVVTSLQVFEATHPQIMGFSLKIM